MKSKTFTCRLEKILTHLDFVQLEQSVKRESVNRTVVPLASMILLVVGCRKQAPMLQCDSL